MGVDRVMKPDWTARDIPDLTGRTAIVTGASSGVGYEIALQLASHGASVVLASRDKERTGQAARRIEAAAPGAGVEAAFLDLGDLASIRRFAEDFLDRHGALNILVNNAGVSGGPRRETKDGFEAHFQINYLGHFALTGLLWPALVSRPSSRVVSVSSDVASRGRINFDDLQSVRRYGFVTAYAQSKLANLLFACQLDRRTRGTKAAVTSLASNPGVAASNLFVGKKADWGRSRSGAERLLRAVQMVLALPAAKGALPALYQATDPAAASTNYVVGAKWPSRGYPRTSRFPAAALDPAAGRRLWGVSEELSGIAYAGL
jgi:NAD(P)-dependent dehydrogenase (short-subunit alcohol dehydrogenase family)